MMAEWQGLTSGKKREEVHTIDVLLSKNYNVAATTTIVCTWSAFIFFHYLVFVNTLQITSKVPTFFLCVKFHPSHNLKMIKVSLIPWMKETLSIIN